MQAGDRNRLGTGRVQELAGYRNWQGTGTEKQARKTGHVHKGTVQDELAQNKETGIQYMPH